MGLTPCPSSLLHTHFYYTIHLYGQLDLEFLTSPFLFLNNFQRVSSNTTPLHFHLVAGAILLLFEYAINIGYGIFFSFLMEKRLL
jgi:hypothetical protein